MIWNVDSIANPLSGKHCGFDEVGGTTGTPTVELGEVPLVV
jgi:hypothetical protein